MKILILVTGLLISVTTQATDNQWKAFSKKILKQHAEECKKADIKVTQIVRNNHIKGYVTGLAEASLEDFKMIFYVKSNRKWYVHPYQYNQNQPSGFSFSDLTAGGNFWIRSVYRVPSKQMVAILVPSPHYIYAKKWHLNDLLKYACKHVIVPGNGDFAL
jgi:hypothetical protein